MEVSQNKNILIIDDDVMVLEVYTRKFREAGYGVRAVKDAAQAFEQLKDKDISFSAVLIDMFMPSMDGSAFLTEMKQKGLDRNIKKIILSNAGEEEDIKRAQEIGIDGYIIKAMMTPSEVCEFVEETISDTQ